jgi:hypothetical protein
VPVECDWESGAWRSSGELSGSRVSDRRNSREDSWTIAKRWDSVGKDPKGGIPWGKIRSEVVGITFENSELLAEEIYLNRSICPLGPACYDTGLGILDDTSE